MGEYSVPQDWSGDELWTNSGLSAPTLAKLTLRRDSFSVLPPQLSSSLFSSAWRPRAHSEAGTHMAPEGSAYHLKQQRGFHTLVSALPPSKQTWDLPLLTCLPSAGPTPLPRAGILTIASQLFSPVVLFPSVFSSPQSQRSPLLTLVRSPPRRLLTPPLSSKGKATVSIGSRE